MDTICSLFGNCTAGEGEGGRETTVIQSLRWADPEYVLKKSLRQDSLPTDVAVKRDSKRALRKESGFRTGRAELHQPREQNTSRTSS